MALWRDGAALAGSANGPQGYRAFSGQHRRRITLPQLPHAVRFDHHFVRTAVWFAVNVCSLAWAALSQHATVPQTEAACVPSSGNSAGLQRSSTILSASAAVFIPASHAAPPRKRKVQRRGQKSFARRRLRRAQDPAVLARGAAYAARVAAFTADEVPAASGLVGTNHAQRVATADNGGSCRTTAPCSSACVNYASAATGSERAGEASAVEARLPIVNTPSSASCGLHAIGDADWRPWWMTPAKIRSMQFWSKRGSSSAGGASMPLTSHDAPVVPRAKRDVEAATAANASASTSPPRRAAEVLALLASSSRSPGRLARAYMLCAADTTCGSK